MLVTHLLTLPEPLCQGLVTRARLITSVSLFACFSSMSAAAAPLGTATQEDAGNEIIVTAPFSREQLDLLQGSSIVQGDALVSAVRNSIGETLAGQPGVSSTSFGPGAARPVLRGLQGERVRVLSNGIGSIDVANTSTDHAVALDPLVTERIEVLRGPATLLYGSSAVGGVVNAITTRLPTSLPEQNVQLRARAGFATAADEVNLAGAGQLKLAPNFGLQFDASYLDSRNLKIGSFAESEQLRRFEGEEGEEEEAEKGRLKNSDVRTFSAGIGGVVATDAFSVSLGYSRFDSNYGIPPGSPVALDLLNPDTLQAFGGGEKEEVRIDIVQDRVDAKSVFTFAEGFLETLTLRAGYADYSHAEIEEEGEIGTVFNNKGFEGRLELVQRTRGALKGAFGVQFSRRNFEAIGEESFVPPNITRQLGLFTLQTLDFDRLKLEGGARIEFADATSDVLGIKRDFTPLSLSAGASYALNDTLKFGFSASRSERAPAAEELFANGPHKATGTFEIGDPSFKKERALTLEASLKGASELFSFAFSLYFNRFDNFITERATGAIEDDLPVFQFTQGDAEVYGAEFEASYLAFKSDALSVRLDLVADVVRGRDLAAGTPLPRIPAARAKFGVEALTKRFDARVDVETVANQRRVTAFELPTDSYTLVNASLRYRPFADQPRVSLVLDANNLFDVDARRHASFLKDFAPLPGRDIRLLAQVAF